ncbi:hypothetical protein O3P69_003617 [Scylla paramamosain]|uniref:Uncharacterized protein n=1 Tax=Scylla paramamosain TaxID=85552 RepID=A0AAW0UNH5_SCYPA
MSRQILRISEKKCVCLPRSPFHQAFCPSLDGRTRLPGLTCLTVHRHLTASLCQPDAERPSQAITYRPEDREVVEVVEGGENTIVVEDERAGPFVIRVPEQPVIKKRRCFFRHIYVAELDICVMPRYRYQPGSFKYPSLTAYYN